jgi:transcriptional regulator with XRE-family HTH domain
MASREKEKKIQHEGIGKRLRGLRESKKMSVRKFAERYGVSYSLWSDYENDRRRPNADTTQKLCKLFHVTADWLLIGEPTAQDLKVASIEREATDHVEQNVDNEISESKPKPTRRRKKTVAGPIQTRGNASNRGRQR